ncbi:hypothetical protein HI914_03903 [Erysiphe necator]|nr:hypothetical protein HI914_03903 [Erysiphe necator]
MSFIQVSTAFIIRRLRPFSLTQRILRDSWDTLQVKTIADEKTCSRLTPGTLTLMRENKKAWASFFPRNYDFPDLLSLPQVNYTTAARCRASTVGAPIALIWYQIIPMHNLPYIWKAA